MGVQSLSLPIEVYFDGLCQPVNPGGVACYAYIIKENGNLISSEYGIAGEPFSPESTNNVAEYTALGKALEWLVDKGRLADVIVRSDSQLVVNQLNGQYRVRTKKLVPLYLNAVSLMKKFPHIRIEWVPREKNAEADRLTNVAYNKFLQDNPEYLKRFASR
ncbi:MAG: ribonuclease HI [Nitrososphaera sp.]|jgi:ribonuclease HI